mmetsp:Transcript_15423/g.43724  ORF Transcript_15423/g.43724 Transcript_15423/m.43724 type:complete len:297 (-) Transcript_15423:459-1349(-)
MGTFEFLEYPGEGKFVKEVHVGGMRSGAEAWVENGRAASGEAKVGDGAGVGLKVSKFGGGVGVVGLDRRGEAVGVVGVVAERLDEGVEVLVVAEEHGWGEPVVSQAEKVLLLRGPSYYQRQREVLLLLEEGKGLVLEPLAVYGGNERHGPSPRQDRELEKCVHGQSAQALHGVAAKQAGVLRRRCQRARAGGQPEGPWGFGDSAVQKGGAAGVTVHQVVERGAATRALAKDGDPSGISPEPSDVRGDPLQRHVLVIKPGVGRARVALVEGPAKRAKAVRYCDDDHVVHARQPGSVV